MAVVLHCTCVHGEGIRRGDQARHPWDLALPSSPRKARLPSSHQPQLPRAQNGTLVPVSSLTSCSLCMPVFPAQRQGLKGYLKGKQTQPIGCPAQSWHRREPGHMAGDMKLTKGRCKVFILSLTNLSLVKTQREGVHSTPPHPKTQSCPVCGNQGIRGQGIEELRSAALGSPRPQPAHLLR